MSQAEARGEKLPPHYTNLDDRMSQDELAKKSGVELANWSVDKLGPFQAQLFESAKNHHIPMQLLAVVILNELGDFPLRKILQSRPDARAG